MAQGVLYARVAGSWVPIGGGGMTGGGTDEVWIGPDDPTATLDPTAELWFDSDDEPAAIDTANYWNSGWGVVATGTMGTDQNVVAGQVLATLTALTVAGRRYRFTFFIRAMSSPGNGTFDVGLTRDGTSIRDAYVVNVTAYGNSMMSWLVDGDGATHTWQCVAAALGGSAINAYLSSPSSHFEMEDVGPITKAAVNPPAGQPQIATAGNALGIVALGAFTPPTAGFNIAANATVTVAALNFATVVGRRYRLVLFIRAAQADVTPAQVDVGFRGNGAAGGAGLPNTDAWTTLSTNFGHIFYELIFDGIGGASVLYEAMLVPGTHIAVWLDLGSYFYLEDIGPNQSPALPLPDTPPGWIPATLQNGWGNYGGGEISGWAMTAYRKIGDEVQIRGLISGGTIGQTAFTLPVGFRPPSGLILACDCSANTHARLDIHGDGTVLPASGSNAYFSISNIRFSVTP